MDDEDFIPRSGPMFTNGSLAKPDIATDLAIHLLIDGGWSAVTLRSVARAANVTPQAIAAWFPSVSVMRAAIADRYGDRWIRQRAYLARRRLRNLPQARSTDEVRSRVAAAMLPQTWQEVAFDGVWLTVVEAGRWDVAVGSVVADVQDREREEVADVLLTQVHLLPGARDEAWLSDEAEFERHLDLVLATVRGLRAARSAPRDPMSIERALEVLGAEGLSAAT